MSSTKTRKQEILLVSQHGREKFTPTRKVSTHFEAHPRKCEMCHAIFLWQHDTRLVQKDLHFRCALCRQRPVSDVKLPIPRQDFYSIERQSERTWTKRPVEDKVDRRHQPTRNWDRDKRRKRTA